MRWKRHIRFWDGYFFLNLPPLEANLSFSYNLYFLVFIAIFSLIANQSEQCFGFGFERSQRGFLMLFAYSYTIVDYKLEYYFSLALIQVAVNNTRSITTKRTAGLSSCFCFWELFPDSMPGGRGSAKRSDATSARRERNLGKAHQFQAIPSPWRRGGKDSNQRRSLGDGAVTRLSGWAGLSDRFGSAMSTKK